MGSVPGNGLQKVNFGASSQNAVTKHEVQVIIDNLTHSNKLIPPVHLDGLSVQVSGAPLKIGEEIPAPSLGNTPSNLVSCTKAAQWMANAT